MSYKYLTHSKILCRDGKDAEMTRMKENNERTKTFGTRRPILIFLVPGLHWCHSTDCYRVLLALCQDKSKTDFRPDPNWSTGHPSKCTELRYLRSLAHSTFMAQLTCQSCHKLQECYTFS